MFCGSMQDFDKILSKINYLEKKLQNLQKTIKQLLLQITKNQEEIQAYLSKSPISPTFIEKDSDYCSIKL